MVPHRDTIEAHPAFPGPADIAAIPFRRDIQLGAGLFTERYNAGDFDGIQTEVIAQLVSTLEGILRDRGVNPDVPTRGTVDTMLADLDARGDDIKVLYKPSKPPKRPPPPDLRRCMMAKFQDRPEGVEKVHTAMFGLNFAQFAEVLELIRPCFLKVQHRTFDTETKLCVLLFFLRSNMDWRRAADEFHVWGFHTNAKTIDKVCTETAHAIADTLSKHYIPASSITAVPRFTPGPTDGAPERPGEYAIDHVRPRFEHHPGAGGACDSSTIQTEQVDHDRHLWDGKNRCAGVKIQALVNPQGRATHVYIRSPGTWASKHDKTIFIESGLMERLTMPDGTIVPVIFDRGYDGLVTRHGYRSAIVMRRRRRGRPLSTDDQMFNDIAEHERVIVENWFGRFKGMWKAMATGYRGDLKHLPAFATCCAALTNLCVRDAPLRRPAIIPPVASDSEQESDFE